MELLLQKVNIRDITLKCKAVKSFFFFFYGCTEWDLKCPNQGSNLCLFHQELTFLTTGLLGKSQVI